jgi:hypothetical protein
MYSSVEHAPHTQKPTPPHNKPTQTKTKDKTERSDAADQGDHLFTSAQNLNQQRLLLVSAQNTKPSALHPQTTQQQNPRSQKISDSQVSRNTGKHFTRTPHRTTPYNFQNSANSEGTVTTKTQPLHKNKPKRHKATRPASQ